MINELKNFLEPIYLSNKRSKFGLMGPAGKLLNKIKTTSLINWSEIKGYISNIVRNNQNFIPVECLESLDKSIEILKNLNEDFKGLAWLKLIESIDYELFYQLFKENIQEQDKYIKIKFKEFLEKRYDDDINKISEELGIDLDKKSLEDIPHPSKIENKELIKEFWKEYKLNKKSSDINE